MGYYLSHMPQAVGKDAYFLELVVSFMFLMTGWPLENLGANRFRGESCYHYPRYKVKTPSGSTESRINAHSR